MGLSNQGSRVPIKGSIRVAIVWALFFCFFFLGGGGVFRGLGLSNYRGTSQVSILLTTDDPNSSTYNLTC